MTARSLYGSLFFALVVACGPSANDYGGADARVTTDPCQPGQVRCQINSYQTCQNGVFVEAESCPLTKVCDTNLGCVDCRPEIGRTCNGDAVHTCNPDGTVGDFVEMCDFENCTNGSCSDDCTAAGVDLIYVVDDTYRLWSFDPRNLPPGGDPFQLIGNLQCPACTSWPEWTGECTPFSMSVDRDGTAWVLYTSGDIFHVDVTNASCRASGFVKGQGNNFWKLFGMGFVADAAGSNEETLYISGGPVDASGSGDLGAIDKNTMQVTRIGTLPSAEYSPELTGTGDAELYGYFPGISSSTVSEIVKTSAATGQSWNLTPLSGTVRAWAFAHWGGKFYIFITTTDAFGFEDTAQVVLLDPMTGQNAVIPGLEDTGKIVVGAGVSTCAPVYVP